MVLLNNAFNKASKQTCLYLFILITAIMFEETLNIRVKISLKTGDFCGYKFLDKSEDFKVNIRVINVNNPTKSLVNFNVVSVTDGEFLLNQNNVNDYKNKISVSKSSEYKFCFKPAYEDEVIVDFSFSTKKESMHAFDIAQESKYLNLFFNSFNITIESFDPIKNDLHDLHELTIELDNNSKVLSRTKHQHQVRVKHVLKNLKTFLVIKIILIILIAMYQVYILYKYVKPNKKIDQNRQSPSPSQSPFQSPFQTNTYSPYPQTYSPVASRETL